MYVSVKYPSYLPPSLHKLQQPPSWFILWRCWTGTASMCLWTVIWWFHIHHQHHTAVHKYIDTVPVHPIPPASAPFIWINTVHIHRSTTIPVLLSTADGKGSMLFPHFDVAEKNTEFIERDWNNITIECIWGSYVVVSPHYHLPETWTGSVRIICC